MGASAHRYAKMRRDLALNTSMTRSGSRHMAGSAGNESVPVPGERLSANPRTTQDAKKKVALGPINRMNALPTNWA